jgi:hypothetical protein
MGREPSDLLIWRTVDRLIDSVIFSSSRRLGPGEQLKELHGEEREAIRHAKAQHFNDPRRLLSWRPRRKK